MIIFTNILTLLFPSLFGRSLLANLNSLRGYYQPISPSNLSFLSAQKQLPISRNNFLSVDKESFSHKDLATLSRYERFCYLRELVNFVARYRTDSARFVQDNWEDQLIVSAGNDPISDVFNLDAIPMSRREIFPEQFKGISHDLNTGRLLFGSTLMSSDFEETELRSLFLSKISRPNLLGNNYHKYRKSINIPFFERWNLLRKNRRTPNWSNANHRSLLKNLKFTPSFVPTNTFYHPILAIPPGEYFMNTLDKVHYLIFDWFVWQTDSLSLPIKKGFIFFNPEDAQEYINSVKQQSPRIAERYSPLRVLPINLGLAYKWNRTSSPRLQFRFIPDLKEIGDLVYKYQYQKNIKIHPSQAITKDEFKGVPIYTVEPVNVQSEGKKIKVDLGYDAASFNGQNSMVFTSLDSVYSAWENFCIRHSQLRLPKQPTVQVYNLEDYLSDCEIVLTNQCKNFRIVPSLDAHSFTSKKGHQNKNSIMSYYYNYKLMPVAKRLNLWSRYLFWSLTTSRRPDW
nr:hypothetical protein [Porphyrostromium boryanum]